jgi:hypothetical protein
MCNEINRNFHSRTDQIFLFQILCIDYLEDLIFNRLQNVWKSFYTKPLIRKYIETILFREIIL